MRKPSLDPKTFSRHRFVIGGAIRSGIWLAGSISISRRTAKTLSRRSPFSPPTLRASRPTARRNTCRFLGRWPSSRTESDVT